LTEKSHNYIHVLQYQIFMYFEKHQQHDSAMNKDQKMELNT